jgi:FtsK/SpoIIIE family
MTARPELHDVPPSRSARPPLRAVPTPSSTPTSPSEVLLANLLYTLGGWILPLGAAALALAGQSPIGMLIVALGLGAVGGLRMLLADAPVVPRPFMLRAATTAVAAGALTVTAAGLAGQLWAWLAVAAAVLVPLWLFARRRRQIGLQRAAWIFQFAGAVTSSFKPTAGEPPAERWVTVTDWWPLQPPPPLPASAGLRARWDHLRASERTSRRVWPVRCWVDFTQRVKSHTVRQDFADHFDAATGMLWKYDWQPFLGGAWITPRRELPRRVRLPRSYDHRADWRRFPVGVNERGEFEFWDPRIWPHLRLAGSTRNGKTVTLRTLLLHASASGHWQIYICDPKRFELRWFAGRPGVKALATTDQQIADAIHEVLEEMNRRCDMVGATRLPDGRVVDLSEHMLVEQLGGILLVFDETSRIFLRQKSNDYCKQAVEDLMTIAAMGGAVGVHVLVSNQRPGHEVFPGDLKNNIEGGGALRMVDPVSSRVAIDSDLAARLPKKPKGRMAWRLEDGTYDVIQVILTEESDLDAIVPQVGEDPPPGESGETDGDDGDPGGGQPSPDGGHPPAGDPEQETTAHDPGLDFAAVDHGRGWPLPDQRRAVDLGDLTVAEVSRHLDHQPDDQGVEAANPELEAVDAPPWQPRTHRPPFHPLEAHQADR